MYRVLLWVGPVIMTDGTQIRETFKPEARPLETEPRWPALIALLAVGGLYAALPAPLVVIPHWSVLVIVSALLVPTLMAHYRGKHDLNQRLGYVVNGVVTAAMVGSLALLIRALPTGEETPVQLLCSAAALW